jgi:hypothetical protein
MTGDVKKVSTLSFLVKWLGYDDTYNIWEPWKNVRITDEVYIYLRPNNMEKLIPKNLRYIDSFLSRLLPFLFFEHIHIYLFFSKESLKPQC